MVTRIEIGNYRIDRSNKGGAYLVSSQRRVIGEFPDKPGTYSLAEGSMSMGFSTDSNGHKLVDFDLQKTELGRYLKGGKKRSVCISNTGEGCIFLPKGRVLFVRTEAKSEQFVMRD